MEKKMASQELRIQAEEEQVQSESSQVKKDVPRPYVPQYEDQPIPTSDNPVLPSEQSSLTPGFVYALGLVEARFPSMAVEKEFAQATARAETTGLSDRQALHEILSKPENRYLVRQLCWVFTIEGLETYILVPRDLADYSQLVEALRPNPRAVDVDCVIGIRGSIASPEMCNGLMVPVVFFDQIYSFDIDALVKSIPRPENLNAKQFEPVAEELFARIVQITDNAGAMHEHRALNYMALRYPAIYSLVADQYARDFSLTRVEANPSPLSETRNLIEVIFAFTNRNTDFVEKYFVRCDVTEEWPFLVTKLSPYFDR
jgi:hypothetical protein